MEYTTLDNLKEYLGITDTSKDIILSKIITRVSTIFDNYLWRNLEKQTYEEYIDINDDLVIVSYWPVIDILELKDEGGNNINYKRIDENLIFLEEKYNWTVYIKYDAWFNNLSEIQDIEQACLEYCNIMYNQTPWSKTDYNVKSKSIEWLSISYFWPNELKSNTELLDYKQVLDKYKVFKPLLA